MKFEKIIMAVSLLSVSLLAASAQAQVQWAERIATTKTWPIGEDTFGMALDSQANVYATGWFDGTNDFGGVTLTNQSAGGSDIFVAKYSSAGALQWARRAGGSAGYLNNGRGIGADSNGNVYVTGGVDGPADFGRSNLPASSDEEFFLAKYDNAGTVQWVQSSAGASRVYGTGLAVDGAGNSYALGFADNGGGSIALGSTNLFAPGFSTFLVKYDTTGAVQWAQLAGGAGQTYATKVALDTNGNVYVSGSFAATIAVGPSNVVGTGSGKNYFVAKFDSSGALTWVETATGGGSVAESGVAVDPAGNVYVAGMLDGTLKFGSISLKSAANYDAFIVKYNSLGALQWARQAGGTGGGAFADVALDNQGNAFAGGGVSPGSGASVVKYDPDGTLLWSYSASGPAASPFASTVTKCAVDSAGDCFLAGLYQGKATFGTNVLQPKETWNFFLAQVTPPFPPVTIATGNYPASSGTSSGGGTKTNGQAVVLHATAKTGAVFLDWTTNGGVAGTNSTYRFTAGTNSETVVANFDWVLATKSSPAAGGTTSGGGDYTNGQSVTVTATPDACYDFVKWTKPGVAGVLGTDASQTFVITNGETLEANFTLKKDTITTSSGPVKGGTTTGKGTYGCGTKVTVTASAAAGYKFLDWSVEGSPVSTSARYSFTAEGTEELTANFEDVSVPALNLVSPTAGEKMGASLLAISGTAKNVLGVASVVLTLDGQPVSALTTNNWTNWSAGVLLTPGANVISAYALSEAGTPSRTNTVTVTDTNTGFAPASLAGLIGQTENSVDGLLVISFGTATMEHFSLEPGQGAGAGNYTYTQTGPDTATLVSSDFMPPDKAGNGSSTNYLTFTSPTNANATNEDATKSGTLTIAPGMGLDVSSPSGFTVDATDTSSNTYTTVFQDATFTRSSSDAPTASGAYISAQYGPMAAMIMETNTENGQSGAETNYVFLLFASPTNGSFSDTYYDAAGDPPSFNSGAFTSAYHPSEVEYVAPESLNGMSGEVNQANGKHFAVTFARATMAQTATTTNEGDTSVDNYIYSRTGAKTAVLYLYGYLPPSGNSTAIYLTFQSRDSATYASSGGGSQNTGSLTGLSILPQADYFAPAALTQGTVVAGSGGQSKTLTLNYGSFTNLSSSTRSGTYTYAPFSPKVGMLVETDTDSANAGEMDYLQLTFTSLTGGSFFSTKPSDGSVNLGTFTFIK